jgi:HEAT repeat protein
MLDIADPTFVGAFLEKLWDNPESVAAIAPALARIGDPRAVPVLLGALEHTNRATARQRVITAAGQLGGPRALSFLLSLTEPQTTEAADRQTAIAVLAVHGDDAAVGRLMGIVGADEQDGYDRRDVSIALEALGNTKIANPDQLHAAQALLLEISAGDHWIERQADGTRSTGQFTRQANRALRNLNAGNAD